MSHPCKQEVRIAKLQAETAVNNNSINNLVDAIKSLTGEVKWLIRLFVMILLAIAGFFLAQHYGG
jgi:hypothetical protein